MPMTEENYLFGRNPVREALRAGRTINKAWILDRKLGAAQDSRLREIADQLQEAGVVVNYASRQTLDRLADGQNHQGVVVQVAAQDYVDARSYLAQLAEQGKQAFVLILDELQDGHNLGACLRVADCCAIDLVVIPERRSASLDQFVAKASAGAIEYVPVAREKNLTRLVLDLQEQGYWVYGADGEADKTQYEADLKGKLVLIIGNEGKGISQKLREHCDFLIRIPMYGKVNSLNASVACGIIAAEAARQRHQD